MAKRTMKKLVKGEVLEITIHGKTKTFDPAKLSDEMKTRLMLHGLSQKLGDTCAGREASFKPIDEMWEQLSNGDWSKRKPGSPKVSEDKMREVLKAQGMDDKQIEAIIAAAK